MPDDREQAAPAAPQEVTVLRESPQTESPHAAADDNVNQIAHAHDDRRRRDRHRLSVHSNRSLRDARPRRRSSSRGATPTPSTGSEHQTRPSLLAPPVPHARASPVPGLRVSPSPSLASSSGVSATTIPTSVSISPSSSATLPAPQLSVTATQSGGTVSLHGLSRRDSALQRSRRRRSRLISDANTHGTSGARYSSPDIFSLPHGSGTSGLSTHVMSAETDQDYDGDDNQDNSDVNADDLAGLEEDDDDDVADVTVNMDFENVPQIAAAGIHLDESTDHVGALSFRANKPENVLENVALITTTSDSVHADQDDAGSIMLNPNNVAVPAITVSNSTSISSGATTTTTTPGFQNGASSANADLPDAHQTILLTKSNTQPQPNQARAQLPRPFQPILPVLSSPCASPSPLSTGSSVNHNRPRSVPITPETANGAISSARDLYISLPELPLTRIYTYDDDVSNKRQSRGPYDLENGFMMGSAVGNNGSASSKRNSVGGSGGILNSPTHTKRSSISSAIGAMSMPFSRQPHSLRETHPVQAAGSLVGRTSLNMSRIDNLHHQRIDLIDAVDSTAPEVIEFKRQAGGSSGRSSRPVHLNDMADLRQIYCIQHRTARESTMARNVIWRSILWLLNLQNHWTGIVRFLESDRRLVVRTLSDFFLDISVCIVYLCEMTFKFNDPALEAYTNTLSPRYLYIARPWWIFVANYIFAVCVLLALGFNVLATDSFIKLFSINNFIDIATSVPFIVLQQIHNGQYVYVPYFLRAVILPSRLDSMLRLWGARALNFDAYRQKLIMLIITILVIVYLGVCSFEYVENSFTTNKDLYKGGLGNTNTNNNTSQIYTPMEVLYFVMITMSTVGYGDITPTTVAGQAVVIMIIIVAIAVLPGLLTDLAETFRLQQSGGGSYARGSTPFVVICGVFSYTAKVHDIAQAFLSNPHRRIDVVLLSRQKPHTAIKLYVRSPLYRHRITLLYGSGLDPYDLERVQLRHASAAFILADHGAADARLEDEHNTVRAWAFDDEAPHVPLYVDNLLPSSETLQEKTTTAVICLQDLKQIFLALNCLYRGIGTLIVNLLQPSGSYADYGDPWRALYADGRSNQFYETQMNPVFVGMAFHDIAVYLYTEFQIVLFGLQVYVAPGSVPFGVNRDRHIALNPPRTYAVKETDTCLIVAASKKDVSDMLALTREQFERSYVPAKMLPTTVLARRPSSNNLPKEANHHNSAGGERPERLKLSTEAIRKSYRKGYPVVAGSQSKVPQCYLLSVPAAPRTMAIRSAMHLKRHILVCTHSYDILRFVCTLRTTTILVTELRPIVILSPHPPTRRELIPLAVFPEVYYMLGDARNKSDLELANIDAADKVAVLRMQPVGSGSQSTTTMSTSLSSSSAAATAAASAALHEHSEDFADSSTIMVSHLIYDMYHRHGIRKYVVTELVRRSNIKFLRPTAKAPMSKRHPQRMRDPSAALHAAATAVVVSTGVSSSSRSHSRNKVIEPSPTWAQNAYYTPIYASGRVISSSMVEPIFFQTFFTPCIINVFHALCGERFKADVEMDEALGFESSGLYYIAVPQGCVGKPYGDLFYTLATEYGMIAMGIYRDAVDPAWGNKLPYVITNPVPSLLIMESDLIYVVASLYNLS